MRWNHTAGRRRWPLVWLLWIVLTAARSAIAQQPAGHEDLGDILLRKGVISQDELQRARTEQQRRQAAAESRQEAFLATLPKWLDAVTPFGDLRVRGEGFYQHDLHARTRVRLRGRLGLTVNGSDEISGTVRLATGDPNDPISTNQTVQNTFTRKPVNLDWMYLRLRPSTTLGLRPGLIDISIGKFGVNVYRVSELIWDDDVSPEGMTATFTVYERREGMLRTLRLRGLGWVLDEVANGSDANVWGGQAVAEMALSGVGTWSVAASDFNYQHLDAVARKFLNQFTDAPANTKPNANFNSSLANSNGVVFDQRTRRFIYKNNFNLVHGGTEVDFRDPLGVGVPGGMFADAVWNSAADGHNVGTYAGIGFGRAGGDYYHDVLKNRGDWGVVYTYAWIERDSVLSIFSYSDINEFSSTASQPGGSRPTQKGATNLMAHIVRVDYEVLSNVQLTGRVHLINALDRQASVIAPAYTSKLQGNPTLARVQLDLVLKF